MYLGGAYFKRKQSQQFLKQFLGIHYFFQLL